MTSLLLQAAARAWLDSPQRTLLSQDRIVTLAASTYLQDTKETR